VTGAGAIDNTDIHHTLQLPSGDDRRKGMGKKTKQGKDQMSLRHTDFAGRASYFGFLFIKALGDKGSAKKDA